MSITSTLSEAVSHSFGEILRESSKIEGTPSSNTGLFLQPLDNLTTRIDYLRVIFRGADTGILDLLSGLANIYFSCGVDWTDRPAFVGRRFEHSARSDCNGFLLYWNTERDQTGLDVCMTLSGKLIGALHVSEVRSLFSTILDAGGKPTRVDIAIDDYAKRISPDMFEGALVDGNYKYYDAANYDIYRNGDGGWTYTLGSRSSSRCVRYYNKFVESGGRIDSYRLEAEFKDGQAAGIFRELCEAVGDDDFICRAGGFAVGALDFVDRSADSNVSRCPRLAWWDEFCSYVGTSLRFKVETLPSTVYRSMDWVARNVVTPIATIIEAMGDENGWAWLKGEILKGAARMQSRHWAQVETYQARRQRGNYRPQHAA